MGKARAIKLVNPPPFRTVADRRLVQAALKKQSLMAMRGQGSDAAGRIALKEIHDQQNGATFQRELRIYNAGYKGQQDVKLPPGVGPNVGRNK